MQLASHITVFKYYYTIIQRNFPFVKREKPGRSRRSFLAGGSKNCSKNGPSKTSRA